MLNGFVQGEVIKLCGGKNGRREKAVSEKVDRTAKRVFLPMTPSYDISSAEAERQLFSTVTLTQPSWSRLTPELPSLL